MAANHVTSSTNDILQDLEAMQVNSNLHLPTHSASADGLVAASPAPSSSVSLRVPKDGDSPTRKRLRPEDTPEEDSVVVNKMAHSSLSVPDTKETPVANHMNTCGFENDDIIDACIVTKIRGHPERTTQ